MNIKQNLGILAQRISRSRNATRTFMMGLNPMPEKVNESSLIQKLVITPLCKMLSSETGANVSARKGGFSQNILVTGQRQEVCHSFFPESGKRKGIHPIP